MESPIVRPEIRRGPAHDYGPEPRIVPEQLVPGESILVVIDEGSPLVVGSHCRFVAARGGFAVVSVRGIVAGAECDVVHLVRPHLVDVVVPSLEHFAVAIEFHEFREGFEQGAWEALSEQPVSAHVQGREPTWFGRGIVAGQKWRLSPDFARDRTDFAAADRALMELVRNLHPSKWPFVPMPASRRRIA